jgi:hypothetical protein
MIVKRIILIQVLMAIIGTFVVSAQKTLTTGAFIVKK